MAIATDAFDYLNFNDTSGTKSFTVTGNDCLLLVFTYSWGGNDDITGVTYDGNAMTQLGTGQTVSGNKVLRPFYYYVGTGPGAGRDIVVSRTGSADCWNLIASYTGVRQSSFPDAHYAENTATSPYTRSVTTKADNCWTVLCAANGLPSAQTASTGSTFRVNNTSAGYQLYDSNGAITPAQENSMSWTSLADTATVGWIISLAPSVISKINGQSISGIASVNGQSLDDMFEINGNQI